MSEGEELVRRVWERWNTGDHEVDPELIDPEIEIHSYLTGDVHRGYDGVENWVAEIDQQFESWRLAIVEIQTLSDGRMQVTGGVHGKGRQSGIDLNEPAAWIVEVRAGRLLRVHNHLGREAVERLREGPV